MIGMNLAVEKASRVLCLVLSVSFYSRPRSFCLSLSLFFSISIGPVQWSRVKCGERYCERSRQTQTMCRWIFGREMNLARKKFHCRN